MMLLINKTQSEPDSQNQLRSSGFQDDDGSVKLLSWFIAPGVSPLTVQTEHRHAGGTVEDGVTAGQTLRPTRLLRACWSFSAIVSEQEDTTTQWRHPVIDLGVLDD